MHYSRLLNMYVKHVLVYFKFMYTVGGEWSELLNEVCIDRTDFFLSLLKSLCFSVVIPSEQSSLTWDLCPHPLLTVSEVQFPFQLSLHQSDVVGIIDTHGLHVVTWLPQICRIPTVTVHSDINSGWTWPWSLDLPCSSCLGAVGHRLGWQIPALLYIRFSSLREQSVRAAPWHHVARGRGISAFIQGWQ